MIVTLASAASAVSLTPTAVNCRRRNRVEGLFQLHISGSATVQLQGRATGSAQWHPIGDYDESDVDGTSKTFARAVVLFPEMRLVISALSSGTVSAHVDDSGSQD